MSSQGEVLAGRIVLAHCANFTPPSVTPVLEGSARTGARRMDASGRFLYGVFTCDLRFDECREALQESLESALY
jgi:hypothetical protein